MSIETLLTLAGYGALVCAPFILNIIASRDDYARYVDAFFMSGLLCVIWASTNILGVIWDFPTSKQFHPLIDLVGLAAAIAAYMTQRQRWKLVLAYLFFAQLCVHAVFWAMWIYAPYSGIGRSYMATLTVLWLAQLVCVGTPGGGRVATLVARHHLRHSRRLPDLARH